MGATEPPGVLEVSDETGDPLLRHHVREQCPESSHSLDTRERSVGELVVIEGGLLVPQTLVYRQGEPVALFAQIRCLLEATEGVGHLQEQVCREHLLEACVDPDRVPVVGEALGPAALSTWPLLEPWLVVHSGAEARRPVGAVAPGAVAPQPPVVGDENGEDPAEALAVGRITVVLPFCPRHDVGPRAGRVEAFEAISAVEGADLPADKPVGVLAGVEVIQGALKVESAAAVAGEEQDERRVPHEQAVVEGRVDEAGDEAALRLGLAQVSERQLPRPAVAIYYALVILPERLGQGIPSILERGWWSIFP